MCDLALDLIPGSATYGDLMLIGGTFLLTSDADARGTNPVLQAIMQRLRMFQGEWMLDVTDGVPWYQQIFAKGARQVDIDAILQDCILKTDGVVQLTAYKSTLSPANRTLVVSFACNTSHGFVSYADTLEFSGGSAS